MIKTGSITKEAFQEWLDSGKEPVCFTNTDRHTWFVKIPWDEVFTGLYCGSKPQKKEWPNDNSMNFAGIYCGLDRLVYCENCIEDNVAGWTRDTARSSLALQDRIDKSVDAEIERQVSERRDEFMLHPQSDWLRIALANYTENRLQRDAVECLFREMRVSDIRPVLLYSHHPILTSDLMDYLRGPADFVKEKADRYIAKNWDIISDEVIRAEKLRCAYQELLQDPTASAHRMKQIADAVRRCGARKVLVTVQKEKTELSFKISAASLTDGRRCCSPLDIPEADRRAFHELSDEDPVFRMEDIVRIKHGKNTIYEAPEPSVDEVQEAALVPTMTIGGI